jgi:hypothetical protein
MLAASPAHADAPDAPATRCAIPIFDDDRIGFGDGQNREIQRVVELPPFDARSRLTVHVDIDPDQDPWDRAGSLHLITASGQQVQLMAFVTGFAGDTDHRRDVTDLAPLLNQGPVRIEGFIDTWAKDGWRLSARIEVEPADAPHPTWAAPAIPRDGGWDTTDERAFTVDVPGPMEKVVLTYVASGHHREDKGNSDEFHKRRHRIAVDGREVWTETPWRTDGPRFRGVNPRSGRWDRDGDGSTDGPYPTDAWSSDFPRSGWVPGDQVHPYTIDLTKQLGVGGRHTITLKIDDVDKDSFWRVSAHLSGWPAGSPTPATAPAPAAR